MERKLWNGLLLGVATTCCCNRYPRKTESSCVTFGMWKSTTRTKHTLSTPNSSNRSFNSSSSGLWVEPSRRCVYVLRLVGRSDGRLHDCSLARIQADRLLVRYIKKNTHANVLRCVSFSGYCGARERHTAIVSVCSYLLCIKYTIHQIITNMYHLSDRINSCQCDFVVRTCRFTCPYNALIVDLIAYSIKTDSHTNARAWASTLAPCQIAMGLETLFSCIHKREEKSSDSTPANLFAACLTFARDSYNFACI